MSSSFLQAFWDKESGAISWEEYIHQLFARWAGTKYEEDNDEVRENDIFFDDPFGHFVWCASDRIEPMRDISVVEAVFRAYRSGTLDDIRDKLVLLQGLPAKEVNKALAFLALQERRPEVLKFCFDYDTFPFEYLFHEEAERVDQKKDPETFKVLEQSSFHKYWQKGKKDQSDPRDLDENEDWSDRAARTFDKGGSLPVDW